MSAGRDEGVQVVLRDATLREGLDTPGVAFSLADRLRIAMALAEAGVPEAEVVAPARVLDDLEVAQAVRAARIPIRTSGLIYANGARCGLELERAGRWLDRLDLLMPLSERREPSARERKIARLLETLARASAADVDAGAGFPHAFQVDGEFLLEIAVRAAEAGARRVTVYDTNGGADPFAVHARVRRLAGELRVPLFFHAHDDLGLATANAWAATTAGAAGLDVTVNGIGDRAGNASLEQVAVLLHLRGRRTGLDLAALPGASRLVEELSGVPVSRLAPVVGAHVFDHRSPAHADAPAEFLAFDPGLLRRAPDPQPSLP